jgi:outer membrane protein assembly factor BamB
VAVLSCKTTGLDISDSFRSSSGRLLLSDDQRLYAASGHGGFGNFHAVTALDKRSGEIIWQREDLVEGPVQSVFLQTLASGDLIVNGQYDTLTAAESATGDIRWSFQLPDGYGAVASLFVESDGSTVVDPMLIVAAESAGEGETPPPLVYAFEQGALQWKASLKAGTALQWSSPVAAAGVLIVSTTPSYPSSAPGNIIQGLDITDGEILWSANLGGEQGFHFYPLIASGDKLFTRGGNGVVALTLQTGEEAWSYESLDAFPLAMRPDGDLYVVDAGRIVVLDQATGQETVLIDGIRSDDSPVGAIVTSSGDLLTVSPIGIRSYSADGEENWSWSADDAIVDWELDSSTAVIATADREVSRVDFP